MADRVAPRRPGMRTVLAIFAAVTVLALGGVWFSRAEDRSGTVANAPKTAAAQKAHPVREAAEATPERAPREMPGVRECGVGKPVVEPKIITLNCSNAGVVASDIKWDSFGADGADGSGVVLVSGAAGGGSPASFPARLRLYDVTKVDGMMAFTGIEVSYTGATPHAKAKEVYTIA
ncbi:hypothetical protein [Streptomyces hiroshimensis]|uniref:Secreted protein n=1 Tax=Streptomyces hiroshimensis TaxID=66424 RepID=A0ABQ2Y6E8_9ACTN|nr:hypothetical protein [Streptomyces hiroshimensis]GGX68974.1 hypothetical protein GCM10010324_12290 [Streptomyces hiroshimensis]